MCGVLALLTPPHKESEALRYGEQMLVPLKESRGPDAGNFKKINTASNNLSLFMGHARLSIIDLSEGANQPMVDPDSDFALTFNGEIYNYLELREQLSVDYSFKTESDTEVLLAALQVWGLEKTLSCLKGMFAFVAYNPKSNEIWAARDRAGEKPLSYGRVGDDWVFSSDLRVLNAHPGWERRVSLEKVSQYFEFRFVAHPDSLFEGFNKLSPGHFFKMPLSAGTEPEVRPYWSVWEEWARPKNRVTESEVRTQFESVVQRMVASSDVPVGCFLSGGIDSSLVAAVAAKHYDQPLKAYTIQFLEKGYDESPMAAQVAGALGLEHIILPFGYEDFLKSVDDMIVYMDEPVAVHSFFPLGALAKRAKEDVKVCLSGDGGDETFGGYNRYVFWQSYMKKLMSLPSGARAALGGFLKMGGGPVLAQLLSVMGVPQSKEKLQKIQRALQSKDLSEYYLRLLKSSVNPLKGQFDSRTPQFPISSVMEAVEQLMAMDFSFYLPCDVLNKVDRATMAYGLEARAPFLDVDMLAMVSEVAIAEKIVGSSGKEILKKWLAELLPNCAQGPKTGFTSPVEVWRGRILKDEPSFNQDLLAHSDPTVLKLIEGQSYHSEWFSYFVLSRWLDKHHLTLS